MICTWQEDEGLNRLAGILHNASNQPSVQINNENELYAPLCINDLPVGVSIGK
jgi:hypothetical protein